MYIPTHTGTQEALTATPSFRHCKMRDHCWTTSTGARELDMVGNIQPYPLGRNTKHMVCVCVCVYPGNSSPTITPPLMETVRCDRSYQLQIQTS